MAGATVAVVVGIWSGCTVTPENYKVLSLLFDGVPDPSLPPGAVGSNPGEGGRAVFVIIHKPYQEEKCEACHRSRYRPTRNDSSACVTCHAEVRTAHEFMHGAVAASACLWCHSPHESSRPALLRDSDRKLCAQCHTVNALNTTAVPEHADASKGCLECHSGHGGSDRYLLKPGARGGTPAPSPEPSGAQPDAR